MKSNPNAKIIQGETIEFADNQVFAQVHAGFGISASVWAQSYLLKDSLNFTSRDNNISFNYP